MDNNEQHELEEKIKELQKKISELRTSRRVLMNLLEASTRDKLGQIMRLEKEVSKLRRRNQHIASQLFFLQPQMRRSVSEHDERT